MKRISATASRLARQQLDSFAASVPGFMFSFRQHGNGGGKILFVSSGIQQIFGLQPQEVEDISTLYVQTHPVDLAQFIETLQASARALAGFQIRLRVIHPERGELWIEVRATPTQETDAGVVWHGFMIDVSERKQIEDLLFKREQTFQALVEHSSDTICRYDRDANRLYANPALSQLLAAPVGTLLGMSPTVLPAPPEACAYEAKIREVAQSGVEGEYELTWFARDGKPVISHIRLTPEYDRAGKVASVLAVGRNITQLKKTEERLKAAQKLAHLDTWEWDIQRGHFEMLGARLCIDHAKSLPQLLCHTVHPDDAPKVIRRIEMAVATRETSIVTEFRGLMPGGDVVDTLSHVCIQYDPEGSPKLMWGTVQDIRKLKQLQRDLHTMAFYDPLTRLPNRSLLLERLEAAVTRAQHQNLRLSVLVLDLDHFKVVNDAFGHHVGDTLLCKAAERLQSCLAANHTLARLGGDKYAIILSESCSDTAIGEMSLKLLTSLNDAFSLDRSEVFLTASIGIARYPDDGRTEVELLQHADSAMYFAKEKGRNNFQFHTQSQLIKKSEWLALTTGLHHAEENGEFELYYQPQIDLAAGRLIGVEALLRWNHPEMGQVPPSKFIPISEESGLIINIGEWVLRKACEAARVWNQGRSHDLKIAVNLSPRQLKSDGFVSMVRHVLDTTQCKASWIEFEITEGVLLNDSIDIQGIFRTLRDVGLSFAIDDFGTGYSALGYLNRFHVDKIKIDRSFTCNIMTNKDSAELVKAIIAMTRGLRLKLIAEGVEDKAQEAFLRAYGCLGAQGYLYGKPMPQQQFEMMLREHKLVGA